MYKNTGQIRLIIIQLVKYAGVLKRILNSFLRYVTQGLCILREDIIFLGDTPYEELVGASWIDRPDKIKDYLKEIEDIQFSTAFISHEGTMSREDLFKWLTERI